MKRWSLAVVVLFSLAISATVLANSTDDRVRWRKILATDDSQAIEELIHSVFPGIHGLGIKFDIIRAASFFDKQSDRIRFLDHARSLLKQNRHSELQGLLQPHLNLDPPKQIPAGYTLAREFIGRGKYSNVSLLRRQADGALFAWKRTTGAQSAKGNAFYRHLNLFMLWKELGLAHGEMSLLIEPGGQESLLHSYVGGPTLQAVHRQKQFLRDKDSPEFKALLDLFVVLVKNRVVLLDLNTRNLVYNGQTWEIIDSQRPERFASAAETLARLRHVVSGKWTNPHNAISLSDVSHFFDQLGAVANENLAQWELEPPPKSMVQLVDDILAVHDTGGILAQAAIVDCSGALGASGPWSH